MVSSEEHQVLSRRVRFSRFWVGSIANLDSQEDREKIVLIHWECLEVVKLIHPELLVKYEALI
jgi:hypothetical protein